MTITLPDDILAQAGLNERDALTEFACRLFDAERLDLAVAARLAGLSRMEFEAELRARRIPIYRPTLADVADEEVALRKLETGS
jgi:predicted HTH domain antitoxin